MYDPPEPGTAHPPPPPMELLAPAGDPASLKAALESGADAVYFGARALNARRRARNFSHDEIEAAVREAHDRGARAYLTLNIDLTERELPAAAGLLEVARLSGIDAVLVRDPALWLLKPEFPELEFHLSTQSSMTSTADVAAAAALGASRVVLAREMSLDEIAAASAVEGVETEVFVQGALCFSLSGRCLMSSWVGGRSGNRGACTSPCRVPWAVGGEPAGTPLSMHDLAAAGQLDRLKPAGVAALKIEGRMKNAAWVGRAVGLYRRILDGEPPASLADELAQLGAYTGREMTAGFLEEERRGMTGTAGRAAGTPDPVEDETAETDADDASAYRFRMVVTSDGIECRCEFAGVVETWSIPKTVVRRPKKAVSIGALCEFLAEHPQEGCRAQAPETNEPEFLLVPRAVNGLMSRIRKTLHRGRKQLRSQDHVELPEPVLELLQPPARSPANRTPLGGPPDRVRIEAEALQRLPADARLEAVIVDGLSADDLKPVRAACAPASLVVALPPVFFEDDVPRVRELVGRAARLGLTVEVNSWGGWHLARQAKARLETGPGLPVLNSLAAAALARRGVEAVTLSIEAGRRQLADVTANCPVPCSLVVFGRPPLMISRVEPPEEFLGEVFSDRRGTRAFARRESGLWVLRPVAPFDLRDVEDEHIRVRHLVVDLTASPNPARDLTGPPRHRPAAHFNYDRGLY